MIFNRDQFKVNEITGEIEQPQIFLCDRKLKKKGEIYPAREVRISRKLNGADEISFSVTKNIKMYDNTEWETLQELYGDNIQNSVSNLYDGLQDYTVVFVDGFGYFEVSPTISDTTNFVKTLSGSALGETELSQILCTLAVNTDDEIANAVALGKEFVPTILYNQSDKSHSLLDRILSYAPNYKIGHVDDSIRLLQRTYSWDNTDIISVFQNISEEINCIFVVNVYVEAGVAYRVVNVFDAQYCNTCGSRHIINGVCEDCGSTDIGGVGENTNLHIATDSLSDEITLSPDGNMKNCFIVQGGDDIMTDTVSGIQPSGNNKVYMFSEDTLSQFSDELRTLYEEYRSDFAEAEGDYSELLEGEYDVFDLILYLQSGRMPTIETDEKDIYEETASMLQQLYEYYPNGLASVQQSQTIASRNGTVRSVLSLLVDKGYAIRQSNGSYSSNPPRWNGDIEIYEIQNNSNKVTLNYIDSNVFVTLYDESPEGEQYLATGYFREVQVGSEIVYDVEITHNNADFYCMNPNLRDYPSSRITSIRVNPMLFTEDYETYVKQTVAIEVAKFSDLESQEFNNDKDWEKYSYNRLQSYYDGYTNCIMTIDELISAYNGEGYIPSGTSAEEILQNIRDTYYDRLVEIERWMRHLSDFIYYLYVFYGTTSQGGSLAIPSTQDIDYDSYTPYNRMSRSEWTTALVNYIKTGQLAPGGTDNTDKAICCLNCHSTNVTLTSCLNCGSTDIATYGTEAEFVKTLTTKYSSSLLKERKAISDSLNLEKYLGEENYKELLSYVREDVYQNSNYISSGLGNTELLINAKELVQQARKQLASACVSQHTVSGNIYAFVAIAKLDTVYSKIDIPDDGHMVTGGSLNTPIDTLGSSAIETPTNNNASIHIAGALDREIGQYNDNSYIPFSEYAETKLDIYDKFRLGNYIHYVTEEKRYILRLSQLEFSWTDETVELSVEFTDTIAYVNGRTSDIASMMSQMNSLSSSFNYIESQSLDGSKANKTFEEIANEGLMNVMDNVLSASNQSVQIDERGILLRQWNYETEMWDSHQLRIIDRNILMTDDGWETSRLAIGLGSHNGEVVYGIWADLLCGNLILGNEMQIYGDMTEYPTDIIDRHGIRLFASKPSGSGVNLPTDYGVLTVYNYDNGWVKVFDIDDEGNALFAGTIESAAGNIGMFSIGTYSLVAETSVFLFHIGSSINTPSNPYVSLENKTTNQINRMTMAAFIALKPITEGDESFNVSSDIRPENIRLYDQHFQNDIEITRKGFALHKDISGTSTEVASLDEDGNMSINHLNINWSITSVIPSDYSQIIITVRAVNSARVWNVGTFVKSMIDNYSSTTTISSGHYSDANDNSSCTVEINKQNNMIQLVSAYIDGADCTSDCVLEIYYS